MIELKLSSSPAMLCVVLFWNFAGYSVGNLANTEANSRNSVTDSWTGSFVHMPAFVCMPHLTTIQCPHRMHIRPMEVTPVSARPDTLSPVAISPNCMWPKADRTIQRTVGLMRCLKTDIKSRIRHICEGRNTCALDSSTLLENRTECHGLPVRVEYQCLPDPDTVLSESICADTYMDVKCDGQRAGHNSLVILTARLDRTLGQLPPNTHRATCPTPAQAPPPPPPPPASQQQQTDGGQTSHCPKRVDVTAELQANCNGQSLCSVNPNTAGPNDGGLSECGKMHLSLNYVCVPSIWVSGKHGDTTSADGNKRSKAQRQPKGLNNVKASNVPPHSKFDEAGPRETRQSLETAVQHPEVAKEPDENTDLDSPTVDVSVGIVQPLFIGVGIGLSLLLVVMGLAFLICRHRKRTHFAKMAPRCTQHGHPPEQPYYSPNYSTVNPSLSEDRLPQPPPLCSVCSQHQQQHMQLLDNRTHTGKCCCTNDRTHSTHGLMYESIPAHSHNYGQSNLAGSCPLARSHPDTSGINLSVEKFNLSYQSDLAPQPVLLGHPQSDMETAMNASPTTYGSPFSIISGTRVDSTVYTGCGGGGGSAVPRGSSLVDSCSGRGCDGGSGASDPCEGVPCGLPYYKPYLSTYSGLNRKATGSVEEPMHGSTTQHDVYQMSTEAAPHTLVGFVPEFDNTTLSAHSHRSGQRRPNLSPAMISCSMENNPNVSSSQYGMATSPHCDCINVLPAEHHHHHHYNHNEFARCATTTMQEAIGTPQSVKISNLCADVDKSYRDLERSLESLTEPLIEPPSNFRTSSHAESPSQFVKRTKPLTYGFTHSSLAKEQINNSVNRPPDLLLKDTTFSNNVGEFSTEEIPLPPPPLRVFGPNGFPQTRRISRKDLVPFSHT